MSATPPVTLLDTQPSIPHTKEGNPTSNPTSEPTPMYGGTYGRGGSGPGGFPGRPNRRAVVTISVASIDLSPVSATSLTIGATQSFVATLRDAGGNILPPSNYTIGWASSATGIGRVTVSSGANCTVQAVSAGSFTLTCTVGSVQATAVCSVAAESSNTAHPFEPSGMSLWTERPWSQQSEDGWSASIVGRAAFGTAASFGIADPPRSAPNVLRVQYDTALTGGTEPVKFSKDENSLFYTDLYLDFDFYYDTNWLGESSSGVNKIFHLWQGDGAAGIDPTQPSTAGSANRIYLSAQGSGSSALEAQVRMQKCPKGLNHGYDPDDDGSFNLAPNLGTTGQRQISRGAWHRWEFWAHLNTPGVADGWIEWALDGVKIGSYGLAASPVGAQTGLCILNTNVGRRWRTVQLAPTYGGTVAPTQTQYLYLDHTYVSRKVAA